jgi:TctA family transporter
MARNEKPPSQNLVSPNVGTGNESLFCHSRFIGAMIGTAVGVLPGLGPPATIALLLKVPYHYVAVVIVIICIIGAYSIKNSAGGRIKT